jgi:hypothetical protein
MFFLTSNRNGPLYMRNSAHLTSRSPKLRKTLNPVLATMLRAAPHAIHFKRILNFGEGHSLPPPLFNNLQKIGFRRGNTKKQLLDLRFHLRVESTPRASAA